jgi:hypothetical protein
VNVENNAVVPRRRGQEVLREMLLAERHELASTLLTSRRREEIAACDRLLRAPRSSHGKPALALSDVGSSIASDRGGFRAARLR